MYLSEDILEYRKKHPRCRFCIHSRHPGELAESCFAKKCITTFKFLQPILCRRCSLYTLRTLDFDLKTGE